MPRMHLCSLSSFCALATVGIGRVAASTRDLALVQLNVEPMQNESVDDGLTACTWDADCCLKKCNKWDKSHSKFKYLKDKGWTKCQIAAVSFNKQKGEFLYNGEPTGICCCLGSVNAKCKNGLKGTAQGNKNGNAESQNQRLNQAMNKNKLAAADCNAAPTPAPATQEASMKGDPHAIMNGTRISFRLPVDRFTKLLEKGPVDIYGKGGPADEPDVHDNYMYAIAVQVHGKEALRVDQLRGQLQPTQNLFKLTVDGKELASGDEESMIEADRSLSVGAGADGNSVHVKHLDTGLVFTIRSMPSGEGHPDSHHLNVVFNKGVDASVHGALPQLWGMEALSPEVAELVKSKSSRDLTSDFDAAKGLEDGA